MRKLFALLALLGLTAWAQVAPVAQASTDATKPEPQLLGENDHYRIQRFDLTGETRTALPPGHNDVIVLALGRGLSLISDKTDSPVALDDGDVRFLEHSKHPVLLHSGEPAAQALLVEVKHHWDAEVRTCSGTGTCVHAIRVGGFEIGQSTSLFTNGFLTAYRDHISTGGTLDTSYYSKGRTPHLMLIALDDLRADFEEAHKELKRGQFFLSDAGQVEVDAGPHEARWIVLRVETPKP